MTTVDTTVDPITAAWLAALYADCPPDETIALTLVGPGKFGTARTVFVPCGDLDQAATIIGQNKLNCYVGIATRRPGLTSGRGRLDDVGRTTVLWCDVDWADPGHATPSTGHRHPPDRQACVDLVAAYAPAPSMVVTTGGGIHAYWCLSAPIELDADAKALTAGWVQRIAGLAAADGVHVDAGVGNADRVLRPPGSHRSKQGSAPFRCWLEATEPGDGYGLDRDAWRPGPIYHVDSLVDFVDRWRTEQKASASASASASAPRRDMLAAPSGGISPLDAIADTLDWADIMDHYKFVHVGQSTVEGHPVDLWQRPGDPSSEYSLKTFRDIPVAVAWSDACGLPTGPGQRLTKARVIAALEGVDLTELSRMLLSEARANVSRR